MQLWQYCLLVTARSLYMFRTLSASIIRSTKTVVTPTGADSMACTSGCYTVLVLLMMDAGSVRNM